MLRTLRYAVFAASLGVLVSQATAGDDKGFVDLFNGKDLTGWKYIPEKADKTFTVTDGYIKVAGNPAGYFYTDKSYKDFILRFDWRYKRPPNLEDDKKFGGNSGLVNKALAALGLISAPLPFMFTETGMVVALAHVLMPYMVLAVWAALQRLDPQIENAAVALGAGPFTVLRRIVLPQVMPGILSGAIIVFALAASAFATPAIIGGRRLKVAATLAYDEFLNTLNWPLGAAVAVLLLVALVLIVVGASRLVERRYAQVFG